LNTIAAKKTPLAGMNAAGLAELIRQLPGGEQFPPYRAKQLFSWIQQGALSFDAMTSLPKNLVNLLHEQCVVRGSVIKDILRDSDGTVKLVLELNDNKAVETVLLGSPSENTSEAEPGRIGRFTACLSTQAGCPMGCVFCKTGSMGFTRNLTPAEIVEQFLFLNDALAAHSQKTQTENRISNIVVMGMGEPLLNLPALRSALAILCDTSGFGISKRKITVSTAGICEGILLMAENGPEAELAVSITSARQELRDRLMPGAIQHPLANVKEALIAWQKKYARQITLEMVLLEGINTTKEDSAALAVFAAGLDVVINLIPWNPVSDLTFEGKKLRQCGQKEIETFTRMLEKSGLVVTRRYRRGRGISGACGQLGSSGEPSAQ
jgi:23S rRNA (adenine2503-C2)-methyltransferase